jgi:putative copper export protein
MIGLVGSLGFGLIVLRPSSARAAAERELIVRCDTTLLRTAWWCVLVSLGSALAWLALYTAAATGVGLAGALDPDALTRVLAHTSFGRVWLLRMALLVLAAGLLLLRARERNARDRIALLAEGLALGTMVLAALAWAGHAGTVEDLPWRLAAAMDAAHLVASGIWLGGLFALAQRALPTLIWSVPPPRRHTGSPRWRRWESSRSCSPGRSTRGRWPATWPVSWGRPTGGSCSANWRCWCRCSDWGRSTAGGSRRASLRARQPGIGATRCG